ncbi:MAG: hypothetical protein WCS89_02700 [Candidatus Paceibacterota bacterium]
MRTLTETKSLPLYATRIRQQKWLDQEYIVNVTKNIMGELQITNDDLKKHSCVKDFSKHVFQNVLHLIGRRNSTTLGKIIAYGLGSGETSASESIPLRRTSMGDAWYGTPLEIDISGGLALEWLATTVIVATAFDLLQANALEDYIKARVAKGGQDGPVPDLYLPDWARV